MPHEEMVLETLEIGNGIPFLYSALVGPERTESFQKFDHVFLRAWDKCNFFKNSFPKSKFYWLVLIDAATISVA